MNMNKTTGFQDYVGYMALMTMKVTMLGHLDYRIPPNFKVMAPSPIYTSTYGQQQYKNKRFKKKKKRDVVVTLNFLPFHILVFASGLLYYFTNTPP